MDTGLPQRKTGQRGPSGIVGLRIVILFSQVFEFLFQIADVFWDEIDHIKQCKTYRSENYSKDDLANMARRHNPLPLGLLVRR